MYCVISWDISAVNPRWSQINDQMLGCLKGYHYVRPVNTFYLVTIAEASQIVDIQACFVMVSNQTKENISFILSPAFSKHSWSGKVADWAAVNTVTTG